MSNTNKTEIFIYDKEKEYLSAGSTQAGTYYLGARKVLRVYTKLDYPLLKEKGRGEPDFSYKVTTDSNDVKIVNIGGLAHGAVSDDDTNSHAYNLGYILLTSIKPNATGFTINVEYSYKNEYTNDDGETKKIDEQGILQRTFKIGKKDLCSAIDCQLYYRPFYYNSVLLLTPIGLTGNDAFYTTKMPTTTDGAVNSSGLTNNNIYCHFFNGNDYDQKNCYGRLFYSIANGITRQREYGGVNVHCLNEVKLSYVNHLKSGSLVIKNPFRNYSEILGGNSGDTKTEGVKILEITTLGRQQMYGITEPLFKYSGGYWERGVPIAKKTLSVSHFIEDQFSSIKTPIPLTGETSVYFNDKSGAKRLQAIANSAITKEEVITFDTSKPIDIAFTVTEALCENVDADTIGSYYNGIKFYENIYVTKDEKERWILTVDGYSSKNVRYYALTANGGNEGIGGLNGTNEIWTILNSITDMQLKGEGGAVRYSGLNNNDYISRNNVKNSGWRDIHTYIGSGKCLVDIGSSYEQIDITANLSSAYIDEKGVVFNLWNDVNSKRRYVIGIYSEYSKLLDDEREEERINMYSVVKKHTPRFSVVKLYKINRSKDFK